MQEKKLKKIIKGILSLALPLVGFCVFLLCILFCIFIKTKLSKKHKNSCQIALNENVSNLSYPRLDFSNDLAVQISPVIAIRDKIDSPPSYDDVVLDKTTTV